MGFGKSKLDGNIGMLFVTVQTEEVDVTYWIIKRDKLVYIFEYMLSSKQYRASSLYIIWLCHFINTFFDIK